MTVIFVVATILCLLGIDWCIRRLGSGGPAWGHAFRSPAPPLFPLRLPEGIFFAQSHTWLSLFPSGKIRLGVDDFVSGLLENPQIRLLREAGEQVEKGDPLLVLRLGEHHLTVRSPLSGRIEAVNRSLESRPELMRHALFSDGWAYAMQPARSEELMHLMLGSASRSWMASELARLRDLFAGACRGSVPVPTTLQDGGMPAPGALRLLRGSDWQRFEELFLQVR
jgi:glycine cleavage system H protein